MLYLISEKKVCILLGYGTIKQMIKYHVVQTPDPERDTLCTYSMYLREKDKSQENCSEDEDSCYKYPSANVDVRPQGECHQSQHHNDNT